MKDALAREVKFSNLVKFLYLLVFSIVKHSPFTSSRSKLRVEHLESRHDLANLIEIHTVLNDWVPIQPQSFKVW